MWWGGETQAGKEGDGRDLNGGKIGATTAESGYEARCYEVEGIASEVRGAEKGEIGERMKLRTDGWRWAREETARKLVEHPGDLAGDMMDDAFVGQGYTRGGDLREGGQSQKWDSDTTGPKVGGG